jgi:mono/diheme cytochrome c family protein
MALASRNTTILLLGLTLGATSIVAHGAVASTEAGRALAQAACSSCHQITPEQHRPPPVANPDEGSKVQAPTFQQIAARCLTETDLRAKIVSPHYPMREQLLTDIDIGSLAQYIRSLGSRPDCALR